MGFIMLKRYIRLLGFSLAITGSFFVADVAYSSEGSVIVGQPQRDTPAIAGKAETPNAAANAPTAGAAQPNASSPAPVNTKKVDRYVFRGEATPPR